jgi:hypothetical protein
VQLHASDALWYVPTGHCVHKGGAPVQNEPGGHERMPESTPSEESGWTDVVMEIPSVTFATLLPIVNPLIVTTKGDVPTTAADVVKTSEVELVLVLLHATVSSATLVAPALTNGVDVAKKLGG